ncbi:MAG: hypothetical protein JSV52_09340 [Candidatus Zixiibacteriota bacterium]|nr:MAG: hypothetical protein JSV52_09340 [candidate division Zixibacteria bacterium]
MKTRPTPSKMLARGALVLFLAALVFSLSWLLTGCDSNLTSVENVESQEDVNFFELTYDPVELAKGNDVTIESEETFEAWISVSEGGVILLDEPDVVKTLDGIERLDVLDGGGETLDAFIIQPYSFVSDTVFTFTVTKLVTVDGDLPIIFDCNPDGLMFTKPAILLINAERDFGKKTETVCFYYLNETTNKWVLLEEVAVVDGLAATQMITHFSKYGVDAPKNQGKPAGI